MLCYLAFAQRPDRYPPEKRARMDHGIGLSEITRAEFVTPHAESASPTLRAAMAEGSVQLRCSTQYIVELGFDGERQGQMADCRPELPLVLCW
jgi:hypothetical protein